MNKTRWILRALVLVILFLASCQPVEPPVDETNEIPTETEVTEEPVAMDILVGSCLTSSVLRYDAQTGEFLGEFVSSGSGGLSCPEGEMLIGPDGHLYVASFSWPPLRQPFDPIIYWEPLFEQDRPEDEPHNDQILRFDGKTGEFIDIFLRPSESLNGPHGFGFSNDGTFLVATRFSSSLLRYDLDSRELLQTIIEVEKYQLEQGQERSGEFSFRDLNSVTFGPDGNFYVASYETGDVFQFEAETGILIDRFAAGDKIHHLHNMVFGPDGNLYVTTVTQENENSVLRFDRSTGEFSVFISGVDPKLGYPGDLIFTPDGDILVVDCPAGAVLRYDGQTGEFLNMLVPPGTGGLAGATGIVMIPKE